MSYRNILQKQDVHLYDIFLRLTEDISDLLQSIEQLFPEYTRHDPSHSLKLESIALDILRPDTVGTLTDVDVFSLLCALWLHDAGMGIVLEIEQTEKATPIFQEKFAGFQRLGLDERECWRQHVREHHHKFCPFITNKYLSDKIKPQLAHWIGQIGQSHGERTIHDRMKWPKVVAVGDKSHLQAPFLAVVIRIADILHFNYDRAPEYLLEHRHINNIVSLSHWRAHQIVSDYTILDDICCFDGVTKDDEAYWFARQFTDTIDEELRYCKQDVMPTLNSPYNDPLSFSQVQNRIVPIEFSTGKQPVTLRVDTAKLLQDLLTDSLYAGKPTWFREILQNAFDACRDISVAKEKAQPMVEIVIKTDVDEIIFRDSGVGMSPSTVENYLLVAGASYWSSGEYRSSVEQPTGHVGKFGIGFMSLFAVAEQIELSTRHHQSDLVWCYTIRDSRRVVRVERCHQAEPGTSIKVKLKASTLSKFDILELFDNISPFPEFPLKLIIDGVVQREFPEPTYPSTSTSGIVLKEAGGKRGEVKLLKQDIDLPGIKGDYYLPKIKLVSVGAFIPDMRGWLKTVGWIFDNHSEIHFGGLKYPALHALGQVVGFSHIPSLGALRIAVSPNQYPLEMNLARDSFITGPVTRRFHGTICNWLDSVYSDDLQMELDNKEEVLRSTIAARYSSTMLQLWVGHVPGLRPSMSPDLTSAVPIGNSPWPKFTNLIMKELKFGCINSKGEQSLWTIDKFIRDQVCIFAIGRDKEGVPRNLLEAILRFDPAALFLLMLPDVDFGITELSHWAHEEFLVPVESHGRCAYGLRFDGYSHPFAFYPRELDFIGMPIASGPDKYAILDYRDFMAEAKHTSSGNPSITAVINRRNHKATSLINGLRSLKSVNDFRRILGNDLKIVTKAMELGAENCYRPGTRQNLANALNILMRCFVSQKELFEPNDFPSYFDGGQTQPFGRFLIQEATQRCIEELQSYERPFQILS